jgi:hypothetical protein
MVYYGCNNCQQEIGPLAEEADIPDGHLCSEKCQDEYVVKRAEAAVRGYPINSDEPQEGPAKFYTPPAE